MGITAYQLPRSRSILLRRLVPVPSGVTTVALEASGVYAHVLFLTLLEAGFVMVRTAPQFARQIKGRPKTDKRDCQWIQKLQCPRGGQT